MKGLFMVVLGLAIALGFLASAAFSQQVTPYTNYYGFGAVNDNGSKSPATSSENMAGAESGVTLQQQNGANGSTTNLSSSPTENGMSAAQGEPYGPGTMPRCIGVSGGVAC